MEEIKLIEMATNYEKNEFDKFACDVGWCEWMEEHITGDELAERDIEKINSILLDIFLKGCKK